MKMLPTSYLLKISNRLGKSKSVNGKFMQGFTLIEILIALFVFLIMTAMATTGLYQVFQTKESLTQHAFQLNQLQKAFTIIRNDLEQVIDRPLFNSQLNSPFKSFLGSETHLEFTRSGYINPLAQQLHSNLDRVSYQFSNHQLIRFFWPVLDRVSTTLHEQQILLENVKSMHITYWGDLNKKYLFWPLDNVSSHLESDTSNSILSAVFPQAVEITFEIQDSGNYQLLVPIHAKNLNFN